MTTSPSNSVGTWRDGRTFGALSVGVDASAIVQLRSGSRNKLAQSKYG